ncbi:MAG: M48 family metallopeptidase [Acidiferrobacterales bacterium]
MEYSNPQIPEGINSSKEHPLKEFVILTSGILAIVFVVLLVLGVAADKLAYRIPFSVELSMTEGRFSSDKHDVPMQRYLNTLAQRIEIAQQFPEDVSIKVHYIDSDTVNAFATLGGNILIFRGLLEQLGNENALTMVLAHEAAHIKYRHPIRSVGRGVVIGLALSMVSNSLGSTVTDAVLGSAGQVTVLKFSRDHEREADETALYTLKKMYGHIEGATDLFEIFKKIEKQGIASPEFFNSHPLTSDRLQRIRKFKLAIGQSGKIRKTQLPREYSSWLKSGDAK